MQCDPIAFSIFYDSHVAIFLGDHSFLDQNLTSGFFNMIKKMLQVWISIQIKKGSLLSRLVERLILY